MRNKKDTSMRMTLAVILALAATPALAQQKIDPARADAVIKSAFPNAPADWAARQREMDRWLRQVGWRE